MTERSLGMRADVSGSLEIPSDNCLCHYFASGLKH